MTAPGAPESAPAVASTVRIAPADWCFDALPGESLLHAAEHAGIELPSSCRNGTCRTCVCRLLEGAIRYRIEWPGLSADEKAEGFILPCVAEALGDLTIESLGAKQLI